MNTFTAQELYDMQQNLLNKGQCFAKITNKGIQFIPCEAVYIKEDKPAKKVIDLSVLVESGIDCEFSDDGDVWATSNLSWLLRSGGYVDKAQHAWKYCKPRMNHIHTIYIEDDEEAVNIVEKLTTAGFVFRFDTILYIDRFVLLLSDFGLADGYVVPWESE